ncbi:MAG TPA: TetR/AcrR family transcriptional regulator [Longimicrobiales bacterium]|nr:TetR/AcrR family transcriptional regulator [Longimicrobiales bacterium]
MKLTIVNSSGERALAAAVEALREGGADALTMRAVAERAGCTATALYRHFDGKDALVRAATAQVAARFREALDAASPHGADPLDRLRAMLEAQRRFAVEEPRFYDLLFVLPPRGRPVAPGPVRRNTIFGQLVEAVVACIRDGSLRDDDPVEVALTLAALVQGSVLLERRGRFASAEDFAAFHAAAVRRLLEGLARGVG